MATKKTPQVLTETMRFILVPAKGRAGACVYWGKNNPNHKVYEGGQVCVLCHEEIDSPLLEVEQQRCEHEWVDPIMCGDWQNAEIAFRCAKCQAAGKTVIVEDDGLKDLRTDSTGRVYFEGSQTDQELNATKAGGMEHEDPKNTQGRA
jgi:hypothetical protein